MTNTCFSFSCLNAFPDKGTHLKTETHSPLWVCLHRGKKPVAGASQLTHNCRAQALRLKNCCVDG